MPLAHPFDYVRPPTLAEAEKVLSERGSRARVLAGGTDLVGMIAESTAKPEILVDIKSIPGLRRIEFEDGVLRVGALATFSEVKSFGAVGRHYPLIAEMIGVVASGGLRNRATLVGNICSAVPCCDTGPILLVYEAEVHVHSARGERAIPIREWFVGPRKTACRPDEIATSVSIPLPAMKHGGCYAKLKRYAGEDLAQASVAVLAFEDRRYRIAFGSVAPTPIRSAKIEALLNGGELDGKRLEQAKARVAEEISPITDIRGSKEYRRLMTEIMLERGLRAAVDRMAGRGPAYGEALI